MAKDIVKETQQRINTLVAQKEVEVKSIQQEIDAANAAYEKASQDIQDAMAATNLDAYEEAKRAQLAAKSKREMYSGRLQQLNAYEFVSEQESDDLIDALLDKEREIEADYEQKLAKVIEDLKAVQAAYEQAKGETKTTIDRWTWLIHKNYRTRGLSSYVDEATGERTDRSPIPVNVRHVPSRFGGMVHSFLKGINFGE